MIPMLPQDTNPMDVPVFYRQIVDNLKMRGGHHEAWHSHKRDPSVCWMCDLIEVSTICIQEMERFISKSALDIETELIDQVFKSEEVKDITEPYHKILHGYNSDSKKSTKSRGKRSKDIQST